MRSLTTLLFCSSVFGVPLSWALPTGQAIAATSVKSVADQATHQQSGIIEIDDGDEAMKINAFCCSSDGNLIAVCGSGPGAVQIVDDNGKILESWKVDVKPESVGVADDGSILVGGEGKLFRFDKTGKTITERQSPHAEYLHSHQSELREAAIAYLKRRTSTRDPLTSMKSRVESFKRMLTQLEERKKKGELNETEKRTFGILPKLLERYQKQLDELEKAAAEKANDEDEDAKPTGPSESAIKTQMESLTRSKMGVSSISSQGEHVFVTTRSIEGYGFEVWKMNLDFEDAEVLISDLRGCCGQMDVQCCNKGLFVAENSRDRVVHFDLEGNDLTPAEN